MVKAKPLRPYAYEKSAFLEDANEDSSITAAALRVLQKICAAYNRKLGYAECARTFIVDRVPISIKTVQRVKKLLLEQGRIFIVREPLGRASTRYGVNWWFRGADKVREGNAGKAVLDCRIPHVEGTSVSSVEETFVSPDLDMNVPPNDRRGDMMSSKPIILPSKGKNNPTCGKPGARLTAAPVCARGEVLKIVHAEILKDRADTVLAIHTETKDGTGDIIQVVVESSVKDRQDRGQEQLKRISIAMDKAIDDPADLIGGSFLWATNGDFLPPPHEEAA
ncbi:hypothetical protein ACNSPG_03890 [Brucella pituitosa]|uniref:hypothetical protein n=1 Tax=Brucella pituitosa TaxID=571256 RepID=UPI003C754EAE